MRPFCADRQRSYTLDGVTFQFVLGSDAKIASRFTTDRVFYRARLQSSDIYERRLEAVAFSRRISMHPTASLTHAEWLTVRVTPLFQLLIYYENRTRGTQEIIKLDITECKRSRKYTVQTASTKNPKV